MFIVRDFTYISKLEYYAVLSVFFSHSTILNGILPSILEWF